MFPFMCGWNLYSYSSQSFWNHRIAKAYNVYTTHERWIEKHFTPEEKEVIAEYFKRDGREYPLLNRNPIPKKFVYDGSVYGVIVEDATDTMDTSYNDGDNVPFFILDEHHEIFEEEDE